MGGGYRHGRQWPTRAKGEGAGARAGARAEANSRTHERASPGRVAAEMARCYGLVEERGRGFVYLGSSRAQEGSKHYEEAKGMAVELHTRYPGATCWSGGGPGLMQAVTEGARSAGAKVAGLKIYWGEAMETQRKQKHPYLDDGELEVVHFFSARKHGLVEAGTRAQPADRTAFIALPGGLGTVDELFEVVCLAQLKRMSSAYPLPPAIVINTDGIYDGLLAFFEDARSHGYVAEGEVAKQLTVCNSVEDAVAALDAFYGDEHV